MLITLRDKTLTVLFFNGMKQVMSVHALRDCLKNDLFGMEIIKI